MLRTRSTHPAMLGALGRMGHGSRVLIADGNFPFTTHSNQGYVERFAFHDLARTIGVVT